jgi:cold shock CspA family protein
MAASQSGLCGPCPSHKNRRGERLKGVVKFFSRSRAGNAPAYGFIESDGRPDTYVNAHILDRNGVTDLFAGDEVSFTVRQNKRGKVEIDTLEVVEVTS